MAKTLASVAILTLASSGKEVAAQTPALVPFDQFLSQVAAAQPTSSGVQPNSPLASQAPLQAAQQHILNLYNHVQVRHSYLVDQHPYDCVPLAQQPAVRLQKLKSVATPPPVLLSGTPQPGGAISPELNQIDPAHNTDPLGNRMQCDAGTIPMRRVTLEDIGRFGSLREFFQKGPGGVGGPRNPALPPSVTSSHKYAHSYQFVSNLGGMTDIGLWNPKVNTGLNEIFSLSQFWFVNSTGTTQTVEGGVQNYPQHYGTSSSVLFIYHTADGYQNTGCYNLECSDFVQTNSGIHLGARFLHYSDVGGAQYKVRLGAYLYQGNWWIYIGGGSSSDAIGYYPGSLFNGGPLATQANEIDFGGEVVGSTIWPPMGSGQFAEQGYGQAAYHKNIVYFPDTSHSMNANLTVDQPSIGCYTDVTHDNSPTNWNTFFYFGGPGGRGC